MAKTTRRQVREEIARFGTGAKRSSTMPRYDLIPHDPLRRIAQRFTGQLIVSPHGGDFAAAAKAQSATGGALKYGECNWEKGMPTSDTVNHTVEHIMRWADAFREALKHHKGDMSKVREWMQTHSQAEDDLAGAAFGLIVLMQQENTGMFHDDRFYAPE